MLRPYSMPARLTSVVWIGSMCACPGADLRYGLLAHSNLRGANLRGATLMHTILYQANLEAADLRDVHWGEWPRIALTKDIHAVAHIRPNPGWR